jgi:hypothetical protein
MPIPRVADQFETDSVPEPTRRSQWLAFAIAALLATVTMLGVWKLASAFPYVDTDSFHYRAMAEGKPAIKPFAFRVLEPAMVRTFAHISGKSMDEGFLIGGLLSGWTLLCGVLLLVLEQRQNSWLVLALIPLPFWPETFRDYFLPDLFHAALVMLYLLLLRKRWWGWAAVMLVPMFLARESTLLVVAVAVPVVWWFVSRRAALMQLAGALSGMAASKLAARDALPNQQHINDTLYLIGKVPWNGAKNLFGLVLWSNTSPGLPPVRVWNVPHWLPLGGVHQVGYSTFEVNYPVLTAILILGSFGLGSCVAFYLVLKTPLRQLLPREEPYLCIAAIYGAVTFLASPMLGATLPRLVHYGWPLFLVYLPAMMPRLWRNWPVWTVIALLVMNIVVAWADTIRLLFFRPYLGGELILLLVCNGVAAWLLSKMSSDNRKQSHLPSR